MRTDDRVLKKSALTRRICNIRWETYLSMVSGWFSITKLAIEKKLASTLKWMA